jgi:hypothetical protein
MRFHRRETRVGGPASAEFQITGRQAVLFALSILIGLYVDQKIELWGQIATSFAVWAVMLRLLHQARGDLRVLVLACLVVSTFGEIIGSLVWGLYTYRLYNVPPFVPPGHVLMLMLALFLAERYRAWVIGVATTIALAYAVYALNARIDMVSVALTPIFVASLIIGRKRHIYAATFLAVIPLELYGTWMGNWRWHEIAPGLDLTMANPPICIGAAYCARDAISSFIVDLRRRWQRRKGDSKIAEQQPALSV